MQKAARVKLFLFLMAALICSMSYETPAQRRKPKAKPTPTPAEVKPVVPEIAFTVSMSAPWTHLLEVEMRVKSSQMPATLDVTMPVWTPGSYLVREYARHVEGFGAFDAAGQKLAWQKSDKNTWRIEAGTQKEVLVRYKVYANELTVRTNELNSEHAFFTPAALLMYPNGQLSAPSTVKVFPYKDWKVATGLPKVAGETNTFRAENFDILYDSPFEVGNFREATFYVQGKPHRYVVEGEGNYDLDRITRDTAKIVEECYKLFGDLPYDDYLFILNLRGGGGLEHLNSTALQWNRFGFTGERYNQFMALVAHEFFHLWNVKRIKPDVLGPFDYENENYTRNLWIAEGATAYYESVLVQRAGIITPEAFLDGKAAQIQDLQERPGRFETSLEEASFDAWIKYYRQDENAINNQISYYDKGELVNFLLDIEIRRSSGNTKSLDDVMRYLYAEFAKKNRNFTAADYQKTCELMAGKSLDDFFSKYVRGRDEIDYASLLDGLGLQVNENRGRAAAYLGANLRQDGDRLVVTSLPKGTPAYDQGLNANDQILAIDGYRASQTFLNTYLNEKKPNDSVKLTIFRFDRLQELPIKLGGRGRPNYEIIKLPAPTDVQKAAYKSYFGTELK